MWIDLTTRDNTAILALHGSFVFTAHREFRHAAERAIHEPVTAIDIDLSKVDYLNSAALGMLLILKDKAKAVGKNVVLSHSRDSVRGILKLAQMEKLFDIS